MSQSGPSGPLEIGLGVEPPSLRGATPAPAVGQAGRRGVLISVISVVVVFGLLGWIVVNSPNWPLVRDAFFNAKYFWRALPYVAQGFVVNIQLFLISEVLVLICGLGIALMRTVPGPIFLPLRLLAVIYSDFFRGVPGVLFIFLFGFGVPALGIPGVPNDTFVLGVMTLVLLYSAYVAEVYRAGLESVHPSQEAAARSLGLSRAQALRYVVVPQAVRRVIPPLLNDFIGLQKDTALVSFIGVVEVFRQSQIQEAATFNFTPYLASAALFLLITVPLTRVVDVLIARDRRRLLAAAR
ncbi:MAG TPA: amino acid ABC transporter permease [Candidatus Sulfotelmatobacter sp.]|nr:amino acid ABC transporter permease [Candidatus Sulfotelmatobacter sp.]